MRFVCALASILSINASVSALCLAPGPTSRTVPPSPRRAKASGTDRTVRVTSRRIGGVVRRGCQPRRAVPTTVPTNRALSMSQTQSGDDRDDFWAQQKELAASMRDDAAKSLREEQLEKYRARSLSLVTESLFFTALLFSLLWSLSPSPTTPISYLFGALLGTAYSYGLGKYVETLGGSVDDAGEVQGAGVGQARFAFLVLLFVFVGKFRGQGLEEIPSIAGFFTYQLASLSVGLREIYDDE